MKFTKVTNQLYKFPKKIVQTPYMKLLFTPKEVYNNLVLKVEFTDFTTNQIMQQCLQTIVDHELECYNQIKQHLENNCEPFVWDFTYHPNLNIIENGFSQGSMMSLEVGTSLKESIGGIISLSGRIWGKNFNNIIRKKCPILIVHGSQDQIIKPFRYEETYDILNKSNFKIEKKLINNMGHNINDEVINILTNFIKYY